MIRLSKPDTPKISNIIKQYEEILYSGMLTNSKYTRIFEEKCGDYLKNKNVVAVANGTSALNIALISLGIKGEVIIPSFTYSSTGHSLIWNNIKPVFADINPETFNIDPKNIEKLITPRTSAILPVHCFGNPVDITSIENIAKKYKLKVIYDAAHAFGSLYKNKPISKFGDACIYSFTPTKILTSGEGGLIVVKNKNIINKIRSGILNGDSFKRDKEFLGITARLSEFNSVIGAENIKSLQNNIKKRLKIVDYYKKKLKHISDIKFQKINKSNLSIYKDMAIIVKSGNKTRNNLLKSLHKNKIQAKVYFDPPLHKKEVYKKYKNNNLKNTEWVSQRIISIPLYSSMKHYEVDKVCKVINNFFK